MLNFLAQKMLLATTISEVLAALAILASLVSPSVLHVKMSTNVLVIMGVRKIQSAQTLSDRTNVKLFKGLE